MANHLTLGVYLSGDYTYNVVREEDLEEHIQFNKTFRPGRLLYVDGQRIYNGVLKKEALPKYDKIAEKFYKLQHYTLYNINTVRPTIPYT